MTRSIAAALFALLVYAGAQQASAQLSPDTAQIRASAVRNGIHMFMGAGGNLAVSIGSDGVLIVDDQYAEMTAKIDAAIAELTDKPLRYVINSHWHWDHTGGNENYGRAGKTIVAHDNTYVRMSSDQFVEAFNFNQPASPQEALPVITYNDTATLRFNDLTIRMIHVPNAHTDSDAFIHFTEANVVHTGDVYVTSSYPFIDASTGGTLNGEIAALERLGDITNQDTIIIPGHGAISDRAGAMKTLTMLKGMKAITLQAISDGKTLKQFLDGNPTKAYDPDFSVRADQGKVFATRLYQELSN
ncbi:MAG: MBL fold metallo-hydrolase [Alphaproteobacteria bacterium]|nr:MBL fold metallo-hydrolase [Alphaproteobacteria bacterium]